LIFGKAISFSADHQVTKKLGRIDVIVKTMPRHAWWLVVYYLRNRQPGEKWDHRAKSPKKERNIGKRGEGPTKGWVGTAKKRRHIIAGI